MPTRITVALPEVAVQKLMAGYRSGDAALVAMLQEFGVLAIQSHDELALNTWENEGGR